MKEPISLIVATAGSEIVLVKNRFGWELPGGKIKAGETPEATAIRELYEETGLIVTSLREIHSGFHEKGDRVVHYFEATLQNTCELTPQNPNEISEAKWIQAEDYSKYAHYAVLDPVQKRLDEIGLQKTFSNPVNRVDFGIA